MDNPSAWQVRLFAWVIQDGNYGDFKCSETRSFALCFHPVSLAKCDEPGPRAIPTGDCRYDARARVVYRGEKCWVIDCGLLAYADGPAPDGIRAGDMIAIDFFLEVDPYMYAQFLGADPAVPSMRYRWKVVKIMRQTAPFIKKVPPRPALTFGKNGLFRDLDRPGFIEIESTNAQNDDGGHAEYTLLVESFDLPAER